jgi:hypothetical protein
LARTIQSRMNATVEITSIGQAAAELQLPVAKIRSIARELGVQAAFVINDVPHFKRADLERIRQARHRRRRHPLDRSG